MIIPFCAPSGTGKTTFLLKLCSALLGQSRSVALIKSTHHNLLKPENTNTDSSKYQTLGIPFLISSDTEEMNHFAQHQTVDFVLIEGGRSLNLPSVVLKRGLLDSSWTPPLSILKTIDINQQAAVVQTSKWLTSQL
ncbi:MAG: hypothetical protein CMK59_01535 [Proteobacteria bacterium]|nr:hypothetical protein [Pseudomonadota bacterium]